MFLLQILLLLQNRGRLSSSTLAEELEVAQRTILRDVDAMTEAGLPIIMHRGAQGGIELGFNYRTRLTGLASDEAEALAVLLSKPCQELIDLGLDKAGKRAANKILESLPDGVRHKTALAQERFCVQAVEWHLPDQRVMALAGAVRARQIVFINARSSQRREIHPTKLTFGSSGEWFVTDGMVDQDSIAVSKVGDLNVSSKTF